MLDKNTVTFSSFLASVKLWIEQCAGIIVIDFCKNVNESH